MWRCPCAAGEDGVKEGGSIEVGEVRYVRGLGRGEWSTATRRVTGGREGKKGREEVPMPLLETDPVIKLDSLLPPFRTHGCYFTVLQEDHVSL